MFITVVYLYCTIQKYDTQIYDMRLKEKALQAIDQTKIRLRLALALECTEQWIIKAIATNKDNGPLTKASALRVIREETGFSDKQILDDTPVVVR